MFTTLFSNIELPHLKKQCKYIKQNNNNNNEKQEKDAHTQKDLIYRNYAFPCHI